MNSDDEIRSSVARLLVNRCNNCYRKLPGQEFGSVTQPGHNWVTPNFGPFCDDCFRELKKPEASWI